MLYTYDPKKIIITFAGIPMTGFADGEFLRIAQGEDLFSEVIGASGEVSRAKSNNYTATATIILAQTSPSNDVLSRFAQADRVANAGVKPFLGLDVLGTSKYFSAFAYVKKYPDSTYAKTVGSREWALFLTDLEIVAGGNVPTV